MRVSTTVGAVIIVTVTMLLTAPGPQAQIRTMTLTATAPADLRSSDETVDRMARAGELQVRRTDVDTLLPTRRHERLQQFYKGIRVYGAGVSRQFDGNLTVSVFGTIYQGIDLNVAPQLTVGDATAIIARESGVTLGDNRAPTLLILPDEGDYRLVYHASVFTGDGAWEYFIDAGNGVIVRRLDAARRQAAAAVGTGTGVLGDQKKMSTTEVAGGFQAADALRPPVIRTYNMRGDIFRTMSIANGQLDLLTSDRASDGDNHWTDTAVVDAHAYAGYTYDFYFKRFGRRGLNNANSPILSLVHPASRSNVFNVTGSVLSLYYTNAFFSEVFGGMVYGDGLPPGVTVGGRSWDYVSGALDIVGHELTHAVISASSDLIYFGESGALNESFADMMGTAIEFFFQPAGNGPLRADYLCGEDVVSGGGLRSLANPLAYDDPDHYSRRYLGPDDNGGVHTNSGIGNQWYYLAIEGGTNRTSGQSVTGVGAANRDQIEKVAYRAFTQLLAPNANYAAARAATIQAARDLYGANSNAERAVTQSWNAVGVN